MKRLVFESDGHASVAAFIFHSEHCCRLVGSGDMKTVRFCGTHDRLDNVLRVALGQVPVIVDKRRIKKSRDFEPGDFSAVREPHRNGYSRVSCDGPGYNRQKSCQGSPRWVGNIEGRILKAVEPTLLFAAMLGPEKGFNFTHSGDPRFYLGDLFLHRLL